MKGAALKSVIWRVAFVLFCFVVLTSHFAQKFAAKFASESTGKDGARVASFHGGEVTVGAMEPQEVDIELPSCEVERFYVFSARFTVTFEPCEVLREFTFSLYHDREENDRVRLYCPEEVANGTVERKRLQVNDSITEPYEFVDCPNLNYVMYSVLENEAVQENAELVSGNVWYGVKLNDGTVEWKSENGVDGEGDVSTSVSGEISQTRISYAKSAVKVPMEGAVYEYSFLFFIYGKSETGNKNAGITYKNYLKYDMECWQVD